MKNDISLDNDENNLISDHLEWVKNGTSPNDDLLKSIYFFFRKDELKLYRDFNERGFNTIKGLIVEYDEINHFNHSKYWEDMDVHHDIHDKIDELIDYSIADINEYKEHRKITDEQDRNNNILIGLKNGEQRVYNQLYEDHFVKINSYIKINSGTLEDTKEVFQEAMIVLLEKVREPHFKLTSNIGTYIYSICRNIWLNELKRRKIKKKEKTLFDYTYEEITFPVEDNKEEQKLKALEIAMHKLGDSCKLLIKMFYYELKKWEDIAGSLGYSSAANARNQKYKCIQRLKHLL